MTTDGLRRPALRITYYHVRQLEQSGLWGYKGTFPEKVDAVRYAEAESNKGASCRVFEQIQGKSRGGQTMLGEARDGMWYPNRQVLSE